MLRTSALVASVLPLLWGCGCGPPAAAVAPAPAADAGVVGVVHDDVVAALEPFERSLRPIVKKRVDGGADRADRADHGSDPVAVAVRGGDVAVLLAGDAALQVLGGGRAQTLPFPAALAADGDRFVVGSSVSSRLQWFDLSAPAAPAAPTREVDLGAAGVVGVVALAAHDGVVDVGSSDGVVVSVKDGVVVGSCAVGAGLVSLVRLPHHVVALSALEHRVALFDLEASGAPRCASVRDARFKGLLYTLIANEGADAVDVFVGGIEDADLDRSGGFFGNLDSFVFGVRFAGDVVSRSFATNVGADGVVTPRTLIDAGGELIVVGRGSGGRAFLDKKTGAVLRTAAGRPGAVAGAVTGAGQVIIANDLDDDVAVGTTGRPLRPTPDAKQALGERLVFTTAMAPQQSSAGTASRFTCEACHLAGGIDGRVHATGRVDEEGHAVTATTKPLSGLFQNPPLFSRAFDRSVSMMVHAEFKVANNGTPQHPWFDADVDGVGHTARALREGMVAFFASFDPPPNPRAFGRKAFSDDERSGLAVFAARCAACHPARVFADEADSVVSDVEAAVFAGAAVFARDGHEDVGVRPLVHPEGARPSSLRGVSRKTPLLTNGAARDLPALLQLVRIVDGKTMHQATTGQPLSTEEQRALLSFLRLL